MTSRLPPTEKWKDRVRIRVPDTPKSVNRLGSRGSWREVHFEKKRWQNIFEKYMMMANLPRPLPRKLLVDAVLVFPTSHRRDEGNYRAPLEKALGDALVNGGWMRDDTPEWWAFRTVEFSPDRGANTTVLTLDWSKHE